MRPPILRVQCDAKHGELVVDNFAGGGGASHGIRMALGRDPDLAVNHDAQALAMHAANHPNTHHLIGDVWDVDPVGVCGGRRVGLAWFSPDCRHHSKCKGGQPRSAKVRALAWVVVRWARAVKPRVIILENVEEFQLWGPLDNKGFPIAKKQGLTFRIWLGQLRAAGYEVEMRELRACDYGAPTSRRRLFIIARCDGQPIVWPDASHGKGKGLTPWRTAAECIDWSIPCPSIFHRSKALVDNTLRRIARGVIRHVYEAEHPFIVGQAVSTLIQTGYGERKGQAPRVPGLDKPLGTVVANRSGHALVTAFLAKHYGGHEGPGSSLHVPMGTITTKDHHGLVQAFLVKYGSTADGRAVTSLGDQSFGDVRIKGERYTIVDIGMRPIVPREQFRAQGFEDSYVIDPVFEGRSLGTKAQTRMCGNSVSPLVARELVEANVTARERVVAA